MWKKRPKKWLVWNFVGRERKGRVGENVLGALRNERMKQICEGQNFMEVLLEDRRYKFWG